MEPSYNSILFTHDGHPNEFDSLVGDDDTQFDLSFLGPTDFQDPVPTVDPKIMSLIDTPQHCPFLYTPDISTPASSQGSFQATTATPASFPPPFPQSVNTYQQSENTTEPSNQKQSTAKRKNNKGYHCPECHHETSNLKLLGNHMRDAHGMLGFKCDNCEKRVARYDNLESHRRTCRMMPPANNVPATSVTRPSIPARPAKRQRVSVRNLQPIPIQTLPQATSSFESEGVRLATPPLPRNARSNTQPQPQPRPRETAQLPKEGNNSTKTPAEWAHEVQSLKVELERTQKELKQTELEREVWKRQFLQLHLN
ncbi:hypothetical protein TWF281_010384 [Arthrobotrys megalospora]